MVFLEPEAVRVDQALSGPNGQLRLDVGNSCRITVKLEPGLFRSGEGLYRVSIGYLGSPSSNGRALAAESLPVTVEVLR